MQPEGWHVPPGGVVPPELARQQAHATKLQGAPAAASEGPNIASLCSPGAGDLETESPKYRTQEGERQVVDIRGVRAGMCPHAKRELRTLRSTLRRKLRTLQGTLRGEAVSLEYPEPS